MLSKKKRVVTQIYLNPDQESPVLHKDIKAARTASMLYGLVGCQKSSANTPDNRCILLENFLIFSSYHFSLNPHKTQLKRYKKCDLNACICVPTNEAIIHNKVTFSNMHFQSLVCEPWFSVSCCHCSTSVSGILSTKLCSCSAWKLQKRYQRTQTLLSLDKQMALCSNSTLLDNSRVLSIKNKPSLQR